jgi:hypothetical protein
VGHVFYLWFLLTAFKEKPSAAQPPKLEHLMHCTELGQGLVQCDGVWWRGLREVDKKWGVRGIGSEAGTMGSIIPQSGARPRRCSVEAGEPTCVRTSSSIATGQASCARNAPQTVIRPVRNRKAGYQAPRCECLYGFVWPGVCKL